MYLYKFKSKSTWKNWSFWWSLSEIRHCKVMSKNIWQKCPKPYKTLYQKQAHLFTHCIIKAASNSVWSKLIVESSKFVNFYSSSLTTDCIWLLHKLCMFICGFEKVKSSLNNLCWDYYSIGYGISTKFCNVDKWRSMVNILHFLFRFKFNKIHIVQSLFW